MMAKISEAYTHHNAEGKWNWCRVGSLFLVLVFTGVVALKFSNSGNTAYVGLQGLMDQTPTEKLLKAVTWNVAAINNNPFEYWITNDDPKYNKLMQDVSAFISEPGANDVTVESIFTHAMFEQLATKMTSVGWSGVNETRAHWVNDYSKRKIISGFVKDYVLGKKRLASMPDRVTNTIHVSDGSSVMRPTVINCYEGKHISI
jgi:hypothetical protein